MGIAIEKLVLDQLKKGQGETNARLDAILEELRRSNRLLEGQAGRIPSPPPSLAPR